MTEEWRLGSDVYPDASQQSGEATLGRQWRAAYRTTSEESAPRTPIPHWKSEPEGVGIALSGGGIRSASFCLGALQSLERRGLLFGEKRAKYLSCVSGGSYIATAFTMVTKGPVDDARESGDRSIAPPRDVTPNEPDLRPFAPGTPEERFLRNHT